MVCVDRTELFWRWGKSFRESSLIRSWPGSDRDISRTLGLLILHQCSIYYVVCYFLMCSKKRQGGSATKFKKYYSIAPSITLLFLRIHFLTFQPFIFRVLFPPNIEKLKNSAFEHSYLLPSFNSCYHLATFALSTNFMFFWWTFSKPVAVSWQFTPEYYICVSVYIIRLRPIFYITTIP